MSYLGTCTFDLKGGTEEDYKNAYAELARIGFSTSVQGTNGRITLPTTMTAGEFTGTSAASLRDALIARVKQAFAALGLTAEIFITVGGDWGWAHQRT